MIIGFGADFIMTDIARGGRIYLHQKWRKVPKPTPEELPTTSAITTAVDKPNKLIISDEEKFDIIKEHSLAVFISDKGIIHHIPLPNQDLPEFVSTVAQLIIDHEGMRAKLQSGTWDANEIKIESKYARDLPQLNNGVKISQDPKSWRCAESGDPNNLWLNLSTGYIGGGRKNWGTLSNT